MNRSLGGLVLAGALGALGCDRGPIDEMGPFAADQRGVTGIVVEGTFVYWSLSDGSVRRRSVDGGAVETVVEGLTLPNQIAVDETHVYWTTLTGEIGRAPKAGGPAQTLAEGEGEGLNKIVGLQVDSTHVYWSRNQALDQEEQSEVKGQPKDGGAKEVLASSPTDPFFSLTIVGSNLFWNAQREKDPLTGEYGGTVREISTDGDGERSFADKLASPRSLTTNGQHLCWTSLDLSALDVDPTSSAQIITRADLDGTGVRLIASELKTIDAFVADGANIYYSTLGDETTEVAELSSVPIDGGNPVVFATGPKGRTSIALDDLSIYWAHENGDTILALPKSF